MNISDVKNNLSGMMHGGTLNKVRNPEMAMERATNTMLSKIQPIDTVRTSPLSQTIHDDFTTYSLPSDFGDIVDLYPQDERTSLDTASRRPSEAFSLETLRANREISIEGDEGGKILKVNWKSRAPKTLHTMNSVTSNGTWAAVASATSVTADTIFKKSGGGSIKFNVVASGDGIQNSSMTQVDMTNEDEVADIFVWVYLPSAVNLTSVTAIWGNNLTSAYWTGVAQTTQADGTAFRTGWNLLKWSWSAATETGSVDPTAVDSFKLTFATAGAISAVRVDNIIFSIGRNFDIKYYSKYIVKSTAGVWLSRTTDDNDTVVLDNDALQIWLLECVIAFAQQIEGADSGFDITWAKRELNGDRTAVDPDQIMGLYAKYRKKYPNQAKKQKASYGSLPRLRRGYSRR